MLENLKQDVTASEPRDIEAGKVAQHCATGLYYNCLGTVKGTLFQSSGFLFPPQDSNLNYNFKSNTTSLKLNPP